MQLFFFACHAPFSSLSVATLVMFTAEAGWFGHSEEGRERGAEGHEDRGTGQRTGCCQQGNTRDADPVQTAQVGSSQAAPLLCDSKYTL